MDIPIARQGILKIPDVEIPCMGNAIDKTKHRMSFNESPFGASALAIDAYIKNVDHLFRYPDAFSFDLSRTIANHHDLDPQRVICAAGSESILQNITLGYVNNGEEVLFSEHGFLVYHSATHQMGGKAVVVAETEDYKIDVDQLLKAVTVNTKVVFVTNPANPTGTFIPSSEIRRLHKHLPNKTILVIDAVYAEYIEEDLEYDNYFNMTDLEADNVVITRSFSKIYGLAALRIGWAYASPSVASVLRRVGGPFGVNAPAQEAAKAALVDQDFVNKARAYNHKWQKILYDEITNLGLKVTPSRTNFFLMHFECTDKATRALLYMRNKGILLNGLQDYNLPGAIRVTISNETENAFFLDTLKDCIASL